MAKYLFKKGNPYAFKKGSQVNLGRKLTQEIKDKISKTRKGTPAWNKGKPGLKWSEERKRNHGDLIKRMGIKPPVRYGKDHHNWNGGVSNYSKEWNGSLHLIIWQRDKNRCRKCEKLGVKRTDLVVHHSDFNKMNSVEDNLILLCRSCHLRIHWAETKRNKALVEIP